MLDWQYIENFITAHKPLLVPVSVGASPMSVSVRLARGTCAQAYISDEYERFGSCRFEGCIRRRLVLNYKRL